MFGDTQEVELLWNGKTNEVTNVVLPFQVIEQIDEPRSDAKFGNQNSLFDTSGRQITGWTNKLIWGDNKLILSSLKNGPLRKEIEAQGGLKLICVTEGPKGSYLVSANGINRHPGFPTQVADTVGAGDAFTAALIHHYLRGASLKTMNVAANRMGSWVASQVGATPKPNVVMLKTVRHPSVRPID